MPRRRGLAALALLFSSATVGTCVYPTEREAAVHVSLTPLNILIRSSDTTVTATAWHIVGPADSQPIPNVVFAWSSSNPAVATVSEAGRVVGIKSGTAVITAAALNFDKGQRAAADTVRVSAALEVDSVTPLAPRCGYGSKAFWLLPPAQADTMVVIGSGVVTSNRDTTRVVRQDVYEPNETTPHTFDLDGPRPFPYPTSFWYPFLVVNPGLFFEPFPRGDTLGVDWYRFGHSTARDLTITLSAPSVHGTFSTFVTDSLAWTGTTYVVGPDSWTFGPGSHGCHGLRFSPPEANGDSTIVAFKNLSAGGLHAITIYRQAAGYGLAVLDGYVSELPADAHEDDNSCNAADARGAEPFPFRDTLTIENPHDIDWIRFTAPGTGLYQFRLHAFPSAKPDSLKDLDLYVIKVPIPGDTALQIVLADTAAGSDVNRSVTLGAGAYYVVVLDFAGTTTTYEVCAAQVLTGCPGGAFPGPPALAATGSPAAVKRHPRRRAPPPSPLRPSRR